MSFFIPIFESVGKPAMLQAPMGWEWGNMGKKCFFCQVVTLTSQQTNPNSARRFHLDTNSVFVFLWSCSSFVIPFFCLMFWYWSGYFQFQWGNGTKKIKNLAQGGSFYSLKDALAPGFWADSIPGQAGPTPGPCCSFGKFLLNLGKSSLLPAFPMASQRVWGQWHLPSLQKDLPRSEGAFWIFWRRIPPKTNSGAQHPRSRHWHGKIKPRPKIPWIHPTAPHNWEQSWAGEVFILNSSRTGCFGELVCFIINIFPPKIMELSVSFQALSSPQAPERAMVF